MYHHAYIHSRIVFLLKVYIRYHKNVLRIFFR